MHAFFDQPQISGVNGGMNGSGSFQPFQTSSSGLPFMQHQTQTTPQGFPFQPMQQNQNPYDPFAPSMINGSSGGDLFGASFMAPLPAFPSPTVPMVPAERIPINQPTTAATIIKSATGASTHHAIPSTTTPIYPTPTTAYGPSSQTNGPIKPNLSPQTNVASASATTNQNGHYHPTNPTQSYHQPQMSHATQSAPSTTSTIPTVSSLASQTHPSRPVNQPILSSPQSQPSSSVGHSGAPSHSVAPLPPKPQLPQQAIAGASTSVSPAKQPITQSQPSSFPSFSNALDHLRPSSATTAATSTSSSLTKAHAATGSMQSPNVHLTSQNGPSTMHPSTPSQLPYHPTVPTTPSHGPHLNGPSSSLHSPATTPIHPTHATLTPSHLVGPSLQHASHARPDHAPSTPHAPLTSTTPHRPSATQIISPTTSTTVTAATPTKSLTSSAATAISTPSSQTVISSPVPGMTPERKQNLLTKAHQLYQHQHHHSRTLSKQVLELQSQLYQAKQQQSQVTLAQVIPAPPTFSSDPSVSPVTSTMSGSSDPALLALLENSKAIEDVIAKKSTLALQMAEMIQRVEEFVREQLEKETKRVAEEKERRTREHQSLSNRLKWQLEDDLKEDEDALKSLIPPNFNLPFDSPIVQSLTAHISALQHQNSLTQSLLLLKNQSLALQQEQQTMLHDSLRQQISELTLKSERREKENLEEREMLVTHLKAMIETLAKENEELKSQLKPKSVASTVMPTSSPMGSISSPIAATPSSFASSTAPYTSPPSNSSASLPSPTQPSSVIHVTSFQPLQTPSSSRPPQMVPPSTNGPLPANRPFLPMPFPPTTNIAPAVVRPQQPTIMTNGPTSFATHPPPPSVNHPRPSNAFLDDATNRLLNSSPFQDRPSFLPALATTTTTATPVKAVPAPRLVGIEPNPGPLDRFFTDGIDSIHAFLDDYSFLSAARTCQLLQSVALTGRCRNLNVTTPSGDAAKIRRAQLASSRIVRRHMTHLKYNEPQTLTQLNRFIDDYPALTNLQCNLTPEITFVEEPTSTTAANPDGKLFTSSEPIDVPMDLRLSPALRTIAFSIYRIDDVHTFTSLFRAICGDGTKNQPALPVCSEIALHGVPSSPIVDLTPLQSLPNLSSLELSFRHAVTSVDFRPMLVSLIKCTSLTTLKLSGHRIILASQLNDLSFPQLRHLASGLDLSQSIMEALARLAPNLVSFENLHLGDLHLPSIALFRQLTSLKLEAPDMDGWFTNEILHQLPPLTHLHLKQVQFATPDVWTNLLQAVPTLTHLSLTTDSSFIVTPPPSIVAPQIRRLHLQLFRRSEDQSRLVVDLLARFTRLESLTLAPILAWNCSPGSDESDFNELIHLLDDVNVLPELAECTISSTSKTWSWKSSGSFMSNYRQSKSTTTVPPARLDVTSRLVGIEPNPGPSSSEPPVVSCQPGSTDAYQTQIQSVQPSSLFNDGLCSIYSYLSLNELCYASRVNHHWYLNVKSGRSVGLRVSFDELDLASSKFTSTLGRHIHHLLEESTPLEERWTETWPNTGLSVTVFNHMLIEFPCLKSIRAVLTAAPTSGELQFQSHNIHSLTYLALDLGTHFSTFVQTALDSIAQLTYLNHLVLGICDPENDMDLDGWLQPQLAFTFHPLVQLKLLRTFTLHFPDQYLNHESSPWQSIRELDQLTALNLNDGLLTAEQIHELRMPNLAYFNHIGLRLINKQVCDELYSSMPGLRALVIYPVTKAYLSLIPRFRALESIYFNLDVPPAGMTREVIRDSMLIEALVQCPQLTHITFDTFSLQAGESWVALFSSLPRLTSLKFVGTIQESFYPSYQDTLMSLKLVCQHIQVLHLKECYCLSDSLPILSTLIYCRELFLVDAFDPSRVYFQQVRDFFNDPMMLPLSTHLFISDYDERNDEGESFEWGGKKNVNLYTYRVKKDVPAARLVGIESNPGPINGTIPTITAQTLFKSGLQLVFSFLDLHTVNRALRTCHTWLSAEKTEPNRLIVLKDPPLHLFQLLSPNSALIHHPTSIILHFTLPVFDSTNDGDESFVSVIGPFLPLLVLTHLQLHDLTTNIDWSGLFTSANPHLTSLTVHGYQVAPLLSELAPVATRLKQLGLYNTGLPANQVSLLGQFINCESLTLSHAFRSNDTNRTLRHQLMSTPTLPRLSHLMVNYYWFGRKRVEHKFEWNKETGQERTGDLQAHVESQPPAPRLVGIETNPGPEMAGPNSEMAGPMTPHAATLFQDGLLSIHAFLSNHDWLSTLPTCQHWLAVGRQDTQHQFTFQTNEQKKLKDVFYPRQQMSRTKLYAHIISFTIRDIPQQLPSFIFFFKQMPKLRTLSIILGYNSPDSVLEEQDLSPTQLLPTSFHLSTLAINFRRIPRPQLITQLLRIQSLTSIQFRYLGRLPDWTALQGLQELTNLQELLLHSGENDPINMIDAGQITRLPPSLIAVDVDGLGDFLLSTIHTPPSADGSLTVKKNHDLPHLRYWSVGRLVTDDELSQFRVVAPNLVQTTYSYFLWYEIYNKASKSSTLVEFREKDLPAQLPVAAVEDCVLLGLLHRPLIKTINFDDWCFELTTSWTRLGSVDLVPNLTSISFMSGYQPRFHELIPLAPKLKHLRIDRHRTGESAQDLISITQLIHLESLYISFRGGGTDIFVEGFASPRVCPNLRSLEFAYKWNTQFEWDRDQPLDWGHNATYRLITPAPPMMVLETMMYDDGVLLSRECEKCHHLLTCFTYSSNRQGELDTFDKNFRRHKCVEHPPPLAPLDGVEPIPEVVPAPPLVGIEPNPGPIDLKTDTSSSEPLVPANSSTSHQETNHPSTSVSRTSPDATPVVETEGNLVSTNPASSSIWTTIPTDWLKAITTYLTFDDLVFQFGRTCRYWFQVLETIPSRDLCFMYDGDGDYSTVGATIESNYFDHLLASPYRRHFNRLNFSEHIVEDDLMNRLGQEMPHVRRYYRLQILCGQERYERLTTEPIDRVDFPESLRHLDISFLNDREIRNRRDGTLEEAERLPFWSSVIHVLKSVGGLNWLTHLELHFSDKFFPIDLFNHFPLSIESINLHMSHLVHLQPEHFFSLRTFPHLTYLSFGFFAISAKHLEALTTPANEVLPLTHLDAHFNTQSGVELVGRLKSLENLTLNLCGHNFTDLSFLGELRHLKFLEINCEPIRSRPCTFEVLVTAFRALHTSQQRYDLNLSHPDLSSQQLTESLPLWTHVRILQLFRVYGCDPLEFLVNDSDPPPRVNSEPSLVYEWTKFYFKSDTVRVTPPYSRELSRTRFPHLKEIKIKGNGSSLDFTWSDSTTNFLLDLSFIDQTVSYEQLLPLTTTTPIVQLCSLVGAIDDQSTLRLVSELQSLQQLSLELLGAKLTDLSLLGELLWLKTLKLDCSGDMGMSVLLTGFKSLHDRGHRLTNLDFFHDGLSSSQLSEIMPFIHHIPNMHLIMSECESLEFLIPTTSTIIVQWRRFRFMGSLRSFQVTRPYSQLFSHTHYPHLEEVDIIGENELDFSWSNEIINPESAHFRFDLWPKLHTFQIELPNDYQLELSDPAASPTEMMKTLPDGDGDSTTEQPTPIDHELVTPSSVFTNRTTTAVWSTMPRDWLQEIATYLTLNELIHLFGSTCRCWFEVLQTLKSRQSFLECFKLGQDLSDWDVDDDEALTAHHFELFSTSPYRRHINQLMYNYPIDDTFLQRLTQQLPQLTVLTCPGINCGQPRLLESSLIFPSGLIELSLVLESGGSSFDILPESASYWLGVVRVMNELGQQLHALKSLKIYVANGPLPINVFDQLPESIETLELSGANLRGQHFQRFRKFSHLTCLHISESRKCIEPQQLLALTTPKDEVLPLTEFHGAFANPESIFLINRLECLEILHLVLEGEEIEDLSLLGRLKHLKELEIYCAPEVDPAALKTCVEYMNKSGRRYDLTISHTDLTSNDLAQLMPHLINVQQFKLKNMVRCWSFEFLLIHEHAASTPTPPTAVYEWTAFTYQSTNSLKVAPPYSQIFSHTHFPHLEEVRISGEHQLKFNWDEDIINPKSSHFRLDLWPNLKTFQIQPSIVPSPPLIGIEPNPGPFEIEEERKGDALDSSCILPNHMHGYRSCSCSSPSSTPDLPPSSDSATPPTPHTPCRVCHQLANQRCSRCKSVWYCSRQCQKKDAHWKTGSHWKVTCWELSNERVLRENGFSNARAKYILSQTGQGDYIGHNWTNLTDPLHLVIEHCSVCEIVPLLQVCKSWYNFFRNRLTPMEEVVQMDGDRIRIPPPLGDRTYTIDTRAASHTVMSPLSCRIHRVNLEITPRNGPQSDTTNTWTWLCQGVPHLKVLTMKLFAGKEGYCNLPLQLRELHLTLDMDTTEFTTRTAKMFKHQTSNFTVLGFKLQPLKELRTLEFRVRELTPVIEGWLPHRAMIPLPILEGLVKIDQLTDLSVDILPDERCFTALRQMTQLKRLSLGEKFPWDHDQVVEWLTAEPNPLKHLEYIDLTNCDLRAIHFSLSQLALKSLSPATFHLTPDFLLPLSSTLTSVWLKCDNDVDVDNLAATLQQCHKMVSLRLSHRDLSSYHLESILANMANLQTLHLSGCFLGSLRFLTSDRLVHLAHSLNFFVLIDCIVPSHELDHIFSLTNLTSLTLLHTLEVDDELTPSQLMRFEVGARDPVTNSLVLPNLRMSSINNELYEILNSAGAI